MRYAEVVFSPAQHAGRLGDWYGPIEAVLDGLAAGERDTGSIARVEPDIVRDNGDGAGRGDLEVALKYAGRGVVALNCAGSERPPVAPLRRHLPPGDGRRAAVRPHAGEWAGRRTSGRPSRTSRPTGSATACARSRTRVWSSASPSSAIPLEVSPTSNVATGVYASLADHPFPRLRDAGVVVTLNSDDPSMFGSWVSDEYRVARDVFGYDDEDLADIAAAACERRSPTTTSKRRHAAGHRRLARATAEADRERTATASR